MKREERLVETYLISKGYKEIIFEPDGNCPPDFVVEGNIAIEVRRLNLHLKNAAIEKLDFKLKPALFKIIETLKCSKYEHSAYLSIRYKRPLKVTKELKSKITEVLNQHLSCLAETKKYQILDNLEIQVFSAGKKFDTVYHIGTILDLDKTYFVVNAVYDNLRIVIEEKQKKIFPFKDRYKTWWLALVDTIGHGMTDYDIMQFKELPSIETVFEKVILIPPSEPKRGIVIIE